MEWHAIKQSVLYNLSNTMLYRVQAVIEENSVIQSTE